MANFTIDNPTAQQVFDLMTANGLQVRFEGIADHGFKFSARGDMWIIRFAWERGLNLEAMADGFGKGRGTAGGDWSGVRDSSDDAIRVMTAAALRFLREHGHIAVKTAETSTRQTPFKPVGRR